MEQQKGYKMDVTKGKEMFLMVNLSFIVWKITFHLYQKKFGIYLLFDIYDLNQDFL